MATRQTDVSLVIRARDEATKAVNAIDSAFQELLATQRQIATGAQSTSAGITQVVGVLANLDRAYSQAATASERGAAAFQRQATALAESRSQLSALEAQIESARAAQQRLNEIGSRFVGPPTRDAQQRYAAIAAEITNLEGDIRRLQRSITQQETGLSRSASSLGELERNTRLAGTASAFAQKEAESYTRTLERQNAQAERTAALQAAIARSTDSTTGKSAADSADVFRNAGLTAFEKEQAAAVQAETAAIARLRAEMNPLAIVQDRLNQELAEAKKWYDAGKISATEYAQAQTFLRQRADQSAQALGRQTAGGGRPTLFGLKPYEITNLGYQINDVVTQLASGTSLTQTLAQQGGQLLQIFPRVGASIVAAFTNPAVLTFAATLGTIVVGLREVGNEADRIRQFGGLLAVNADGGVFDPAKLNAATEALDRYGLSAEDAVKAVRTFVKEGVDPSSIEQFGRTASDLAEVMGVDLTDAAKQVGEAFTGGFNAIEKLDEQYNFLTASEREHIRTLFDEGKAADARNEAFRIFSDRMQDGANKMRGPWTSAIRELGSAWQEFTAFLSDLAPIRGVANALEGLGRQVASLLRTLRGARTIADIEADIANTQAIINNRRAAGMDAGMFGNQLAQLQAERAAVEARNKLDEAGVKTQGELLELRGKTTQKLQDEIKAQQQNKSVEEEVTEARRKAQDYVEEEFKFADQATKQAYVNQKVAEARAAAQKRIADQAKREADEVKRAAEERRRGYIQDIQDNGREDVLATARRFEGQSETANRGSLMDFFRQNGVNVDPKMVAWCAAFVNAVLASNGIKGTGSLSARSFLNFGQDSTSNPQEGDIVVLRRGNNNAQGHVGFFQGFDERGNVRVLGGNQGDRVSTQTFNRDDVLGFRRVPNAAQVAQEEQKATDDLVKKQNEFNDSLAREGRQREQNAQIANEQRGLTGEALIDAQREAEVQRAITAAREKAAKDNLQFSDAQAAAIRKQVELEFEATRGVEARARAQQEAAESEMNALTERRDLLQQQIQFANDNGQAAFAQQLQVELDAVNAKLASAIENVKTFWKEVLAGQHGGAAAFGLTSDQIQNIILKLDTARQSTQSWGTLLGVTGQQIAQTFASTATSAIDRFAQAIADGEKPITALRDAFLQFAADFLRQIAQMILQQTIFNIVSGLVRSITGGIGGGAGSAAGLTGAGFTSATIAHTGGVIGGGGLPSRLADASWFQNATRYHSGGIAGLRPDEVPAILRRGEEVLTEADPRHRANGGGAAAVTPEIKVINAIDAGDMVQKALNTKPGQKAFLNFIRENQTAVRGAIGG